MQVPYQAAYIKRLVAEATAKEEGSTELMTQRITSSLDASTSQPSADSADEADGQFNTDVRPPTLPVHLAC